MAITHGINTSKQATSVSTPVTVATGVHFVVGAAPVQMVGGKVNEVIMLNTYEEAVQLLGYSDDWQKYDLCMEIYSAFQLYNVAPVFVVNVLDPGEAQDQEDRADRHACGKSGEAAPGSHCFQRAGDGQNGGHGLRVFYTDTNCVVEFTADTTEEVTLAWDEVDPTQLTKADVIGGYSVSTHQTTGMELIGDCFAKYTIAPDLILCPNWSHDAEVAAVMSAKAENINGLFEADAVLDLPCGADGVTYYTEAPAAKKKLNFSNPNQLVCWPKR